MANIQYTISNIDLEEFTAKRTILKMSLGIILVFDLGKPETFQQLKEKMPEITQHAGFIPIILIGTNKEAEKEGVMIPSMDIDQFMFKYGIASYFRVSTQTGEHIQEAFEALSTEILKENIRKLGREEVRNKKNFNFTIAMIGAESIRKDLISESGVQHFISPSAIGGAISRKSLDLDIHHLFEPPKDTSPEPTAPSTKIKDIRVEEVQEKVKPEPSKLHKEIQEISGDLAKEEKFGEIEKETFREITPEKKEEVTLKKPAPLEPIAFSEADDKTELSDELKTSIRDEVERLKGIMTGKAAEGTGGAPPSPPPPPASSPSKPPASMPEAPAKAAPPPKPPAGPPAGLPKTEAGREEDTGLREELLGELKRIKDEKEAAESMGKKKKAKGKAAFSAKRKRMSSKTLKMDSAEFESAPPPAPKAAATPVTSAPVPEPAPEAIKREFEFEEDLMPDEEEPEEPTLGGVEKAPKLMEVTTEKLLRKTTVFYRERMNPETLNKLAVVLSTEKIYEKLKIKIEEIARAATDRTLEIDKDVPIVEVVPEFPGCVSVPSMRKINAEKEYDTATFLITPLQTGEIEDACVKLYHKGKLIETIPTPTKVVKTTAAKVSAGVAVIVPLLSSFPIIYNPISEFLSNLIPFYSAIGELEGIVLILTGLFALISGVFYLFKRPKDAKPVETFPELDEKLHNRN